MQSSYQIRLLKGKPCDDLAKAMAAWCGIYAVNSINLWWVVYHKGQWIGFAGMSQFTDKHTYYFGPTEINEEHRGKGLQKRLLKIREKYARKIGVKKLISSTDHNNYISANNLIKAGFMLCEPPHYSTAKGFYFYKDLIV